MNVLAIAGAFFLNSPDSLYTQAVAEQAWLQQGTSIVSLSLTKSAPATALEIVSWFRAEGLPIAAIAEIARVERKSIYAWINGGPIRQQNQDRLEKIYSYLSKEQQTELIHLYRFWNRQLSRGESLSKLLQEESLNENSIKQALSELWPMALKVKATFANDHKINRKKNNPFLEEINETTTPDES